MRGVGGGGEREKEKRIEERDRPFEEEDQATTSEKEKEALTRHSPTTPSHNNNNSSLGCLDPHCALCEHNPRRRCSVNFAPKYLVNDVLRAKCDAAIRVEVIDRATGLPASPSDLQGVALEVCVLDGNAYDARCVESGAEREGDLDACALLLNNRGAPLLAFGGGGGGGAAAGAGPAGGAGGPAGGAAPSASAVGVGGASHAPDGRVLLPLGRGPGGAVPLPDLHVTDSSEAMLSGRKPPFRLLVRAVFKGGGGGASAGAAAAAAAAAAASTGGNGRKGNEPSPPARHAVSEGFVVATRRTRTAGKVEIPNVDDHVSKLEHMGKETVKKLQVRKGEERERERERKRESEKRGEREREKGERERERERKTHFSKKHKKLSNRTLPARPAPRASTWGDPTRGPCLTTASRAWAPSGGSPCWPRGTAT